MQIPASPMCQHTLAFEVIVRWSDGLFFLYHALTQDVPQKGTDADENKTMTAIKERKKKQQEKKRKEQRWGITSDRSAPASSFNRADHVSMVQSLSAFIGSVKKTILICYNITMSMMNKL